MRKYGADLLFGISCDRDIVIYTGYEAPHGYISQVSDSYMTLDAAKEKFGLVGHPDIDVVEHVVDTIMDVASKYESEVRKRIEREKAYDTAAETLADSVMGLLCKEDALRNLDTFDAIATSLFKLNSYYGRVSSEAVMLFMGCTHYFGAKVSGPVIDFDNDSGKSVMVQYSVTLTQPEAAYNINGEVPPTSTRKLVVTKNSGEHHLILDVDLEDPKQSMSLCGRSTLTAKNTVMSSLPAGTKRKPKLCATNIILFQGQTTTIGIAKPNFRKFSNYLLTYIR